MTVFCLHWQRKKDHTLPSPAKANRPGRDMTTQFFNFQGQIKPSTERNFAMYVH